MKNLVYIVALIFIMSCNSNRTDEKNVVKSELEKTNIPVLLKAETIIGERIDGPANIRSKPNGDILFELHDDVLVETSTKLDKGWYQVLVYADIEYEEFEMDSILGGRSIMLGKDTIGKVLKTHYVDTGRGENHAYAMLYGYTHEDNIKPETLIENMFQNNLVRKGRDFSSWISFIKIFNLEKGAIGYEKFESYYNYENSIDDPSPGFRIVLLFEGKILVGLIHSREMEIDKTTTHKLDRSYYVTFFNDYSEKGQMEFVNYMNEWIQQVD